MQRTLQYIFGGLLLIIAIVALYCLTHPQPRAIAREAAPVQCRHNLRQIALALQLYHDDHGSLPPAHIAGPEGTPYHSWRVLILPYLELKDLYDKYRFDEPWNGPNNAQLAAPMPEVFRCPVETYLGKPAKTSFFAVVGKKTYWPDALPRAMIDTKAGASKSVLLVEMSESGVDWLEPKDLVFDQMSFEIDGRSSQTIRSLHGPGAHVAFGDGEVRLLKSMDSQYVKKMLLVDSTNDAGDE